MRRRRLPPPAAAWVYELSEWGQELEPAVLALGRWASGSPSFPRAGEMGPDSLVLALKATFDQAKVQGLDATYQLVLGEMPFRIEVREGRLEARHGEVERPDATIRGDTDAISAIVFGGRSLADGLGAGEIEVEGGGESVRRLFRALT